MYTSIQKTTNIFKLLALGLLINIAQSCSQKSDPLSGHGEKIEVKVSLTDAIYEEVSDLSRAATPYLTDPYARSRIQRGEEIQLDEDLFMTAELIPERRDDTLNGELFSGDALKDRTRAAAEITPVTTGVAYKLLVYAANGAYVTERDYIRGQEASAPALLLDGGSTYSFIAYSVNTTTAPPAVTFTGGTQTLAASNVSITGVQDFMYFRQEMTVLGSTTNNLNVILRHRMSQITTTINANAVAYNVTAVTASFSRHQPSATVPLSTGLPTRSGTIGTRAVTFASLGTRSVTSTPTIINAATNSLTNFVISSIQIGSITRTSLTPFTNLTITPGVKYNLVLNITANDIYSTLEGRPAARINGRLWLRHNVGVTTTHDADNFGTNNQHLIGNYYQYGVAGPAVVVATGSTSAGAISGWTTSYGTGEWTATRGPCPGTSDGGLRLPTVAEVEALYAATIATDIGNWNNSSTNYTAAKVLTSRRNANVKLTFPIAGWRDSANGALNWRGDTGFYWVLGSQSTHQANHMYLARDENVVAARDWRYGFTARCTDQ